jgi:hypothetical protein
VTTSLCRQNKIIPFRMTGENSFGNKHYHEQIQTISVVGIKIPKEAVLFCLNVPLWIFLGTTDQIEKKTPQL